MTYTKEQLQRFVTELQTTDAELSTWETEFLRSVATQLQKGWRLSDRQTTILGRMYGEKVAS